MFQASDKQKLPIESTNATGTHLYDLNDDCLLKIFSEKPLDLMDLCSLADTCKRFRGIAQLQVKRIASKELFIRICDGGNCIVKSRKHFNIQLGEYELERFLKQFGSLLHEVSIFGCGDVDGFPLNLVVNHCKYALESLRILFITISNVLTIKLKPIFKRLQSLHLKDVSITADRTLFADCNALVQLTVKSVHQCVAILENNFPKLERFAYENDSDKLAHSTLNRDEETVETLSSFILRHSSLKAVDLSSRMDDSGKRILLQVICDNCNQLEELRINFENLQTDFLQPLRSLKLLKTLRLFGAFMNSLLPLLTELRELRLYSCPLDRNTDHFSNLTQLTKLTMICCGYTDVIGLISQLVNLKQLIIVALGNSMAYDRDWMLHRPDRIFKLDEKTFSRIADIVKGRPNVLTLYCNFDFNMQNFDGNQNVKLFRTFQ